MFQIDREKVQEAQKLLGGETTTLEKFESVRTLLKGISPKIDIKLETVSRAFQSIEKLKKGEVIELSAENLPEETEREKKRKKAILFLIKNFKDLKSEIHRVQTEFENQGANTSAFAKIAAFAKGPFGLTTLAAVFIVGAFFVFNKTGKETLPQTNQPIQEVTTNQKQTVKVISYKEKLIPLSELVARSGHDCDREHYHAQNGQDVKALDGTVIPDPGACAFGKLTEVKIEEVNSP